MVERKTTAEHRQALVDGLRGASQRGELAPGDMLPTTRELARRYGLSIGTAAAELQRLIEQGVLRSVPRVGTFLVRPMTTSEGLYLLLAPAPGMPLATAPHLSRIRMGFEKRIGELGAGTITVPIDVAAERRRAGALSSVIGVFDASSTPRGRAVWDPADPAPRCRYATYVTAEMLADKDAVDTIHFDDVDGGRQAARHLLEHGHRRIAFLGLHSSPDDLGMYVWSHRRETGWVEVLTEAGTAADGLSFLPEREPAGYSDETEVAATAARRLIGRRDFTGVVCANDNAVMGLVRTLREAGVPDREWPSVVGFDDILDTQSHVVTSLRLPWEELGRTAADVLWARVNGRRRRRAQLYDVRMTIVPRMSSRPTWSHEIGGILPTEPG
jgi:DNA-binding LacI/PurR family transcriptional regulator